MDSSLSQPTFDPSLYPRTYRTSTGWLIFLVGGGALMAFGGLALLCDLAGIVSFDAATTGSIEQNILIAALSLGLLFIGAYCAASPLRVRVTLHADAIDVRNLRGLARMRRDEIKGASISRSTYQAAMIPHSPARKPLRVPLNLNRDPAFNEWFIGLIDLDAAELQKSIAEVAVDAKLGASEEDRIARVNRARKIATVLSIAVIALAAWALFYPYPYRLIIAALAAIPWLALVLVIVWRGAFKLNGERNDARPHLGVLLLLPGIVLALRAFLDLQSIGWMWPLALALMGGLVLAASAACVDVALRRRPSEVFLGVILLMPYGFGVSLEANATFDHGRAEVFRPSVIDKQISSKPIQWRLLIEPWGPYTEPNDVTVRRSLYDAVAPGSAVCVYLWPGALAIPWYVVERCR